MQTPVRLHELTSEALSYKSLRSIGATAWSSCRCLTHENKWTLWASRVFEHASMVANQRDKRVLGC